MQVAVTLFGTVADVCCSVLGFNNTTLNYSVSFTGLLWVFLIGRLAYTKPLLFTTQTPGNLQHNIHIVDCNSNLDLLCFVTAFPKTYKCLCLS